MKIKKFNENTDYLNNDSKKALLDIKDIIEIDINEGYGYDVKYTEGYSRINRDGSIPDQFYSSNNGRTKMEHENDKYAIRVELDGKIDSDSKIYTENDENNSHLIDYMIETSQIAKKMYNRFKSLSNLIYVKYDRYIIYFIISFDFDNNNNNNLHSDTRIKRVYGILNDFVLSNYNEYKTFGESIRKLDMGFPNLVRITTKSMIKDNKIYITVTGVKGGNRSNLEKITLSDEQSKSLMKVFCDKVKDNWKMKQEKLKYKIDGKNIIISL